MNYCYYIRDRDFDPVLVVLSVESTVRTGLTGTLQCTAGFFFLLLCPYFLTTLLHKLIWTLT